MQAIKKVEIIIEKIQAKKIIKILDELNLKGFTRIGNVTGQGKHGDYDGEELSDIFRNAIIIIACTETEAHNLVARIEPYLKRSGGLVLVTDALWVHY